MALVTKESLKVSNKSIPWFQRSCGQGMFTLSYNRKSLLFDEGNLYKSISKNKIEGAHCHEFLKNSWFIHWISITGISGGKDRRCAQRNSTPGEWEDLVLWVSIFFLLPRFSDSILELFGRYGIFLFFIICYVHLN